MNILLIGGSGTFINSLIDKFRKENHRVYLLTGRNYQSQESEYSKVFETYHLSYDKTVIMDVMKSVNPDITIFMGAFDTNFIWAQENADSLHYIAGLMNILNIFSACAKGRFVYLSSNDVYEECKSDIDIAEEVQPTSKTVRGMALAEGESICQNFSNKRGIDIITLRLDHLCTLPVDRNCISNVCDSMCLDAMSGKTIYSSHGRRFSLLYEADAVELVSKAAVAPSHNFNLYNISSAKDVSEAELSLWIKEELEGASLKDVEKKREIIIEEPKPCIESRLVLSNRRYASEFGLKIFHDARDIVKMTTAHMYANKARFLAGYTIRPTMLKRIAWHFKQLSKDFIPLIENFVGIFIVLFVSYKTANNAYFGELNLFLLYVLLFAGVYGQAQAAIAATLSFIGYCILQGAAYGGLAVLTDTNTYIWLAQLFIVGLVCGNMRDVIKVQKQEYVEEVEFIKEELVDIRSINRNSIRVKNALEEQVVMQKDSIGKVYAITSKLDQLTADEVLFQAVEVIEEMLGTKDVAIYLVANDEYARLFAASSKKARSLGKSIRYKTLENMYDELSNGKVYINRKLEESYPVMADAIFDGDRMEAVIMAWGLPWERMSLAQANLLQVIALLIERSMLRAMKYINMRSNLLDDAGQFREMIKTYTSAKKKNLIGCEFLTWSSDESKNEENKKRLLKLLRDTDYVGPLEDGSTGILLTNVNDIDLLQIMERLQNEGFTCLKKGL